MRRDIQWTTSGLRLRRRASRAGDLNWLFLPGGPGIGSESLHELVDTVDVPGCSWMVDLPGDGSNVNAPGAPADPYDLWPQVLLEAAHAVAHPVFVGHSTGGEYLLSVPALDGCLAGLALVSTAPDASWIPVFEHMTRNNRLPASNTPPPVTCPIPPTTTFAALLWNLRRGTSPPTPLPAGRRSLRIAL
ncbi:alpha/beta hydrolase family protein [Mycobacterium kansasii 662]|uniref:Alpha/beta hydrolase family protein n=1 Tax=Mycobacterium kansasii 662 TaxID=1299326 RepID=X7YN90_MYCKA|nr:alpha/beta hydrolase family protein [Mycobacterium kansasii 662]